MQLKKHQYTILVLDKFNGGIQYHFYAEISKKSIRYLKYSFYIHEKEKYNSKLQIFNMINIYAGYFLIVLSTFTLNLCQCRF